LKLVFSSEHTTIKALTASLSAFLFVSFFGNIVSISTRSRQSHLEAMYLLTNIVFSSVSLFTWVFTDCMMKKLVIFIALLYITPSILVVNRPKLFSGDRETQNFIAIIGYITIAAFLPLLQLPLIPGLVSNFKSDIGPHADSKVNDFSAGVFFAFYTGGALTMNFIFGLGEYYTKLPYDILFAITVIFLICYVCCVDVKSTCRKDSEIEAMIA